MACPPGASTRMKPRSSLLQRNRRSQKPSQTDQTECVPTSYAHAQALGSKRATSVQIRPQNCKFHGVTAKATMVELHKLHKRAELCQDTHPGTCVPEATACRILNTLQKTSFLGCLENFGGQSVKGVKLICVRDPGLVCHGQA